MDSEEILVVFGSKSDEPVFSGISETLSKSDIKHKVMTISAHRSPELLQEALAKTTAKVIIAGAGLAAHLPGVVASKAIKPVIGVPVKSNLNGLDSFLSIVQMPPWIPVMSVGVDKSEMSALHAEAMLKGCSKVNIIGDKENKRVKKCVEVLEDYGVSYDFSQEFSEDSINIRFAELADLGEETNALVLTVPLVDDANKDSLADEMMEKIGNGLWLGLNRGENAAVAAIEILAINNQELSEKLKAFRNEMKEKIRGENDI